MKIRQFRKTNAKYSNKFRPEFLRSVRLMNHEWRRKWNAFRDADIELLRQAAKTFGGVEGAVSFLTRAARGLNGKVPVSCAATAKGRAEVMLLMKRIDRGILA